jgi:glycosyltransferase involved in cell wall biosynthesis
LILRRSDKIIVYSDIARNYLRQIFPDKPIHQIGLYADENFFTPSRSDVVDCQTFIFAPGDHKREEQLLGDIGQKLSLKVIRVTRNPGVRDSVEALAHSSVELRYNVSFDELRALYQTCSVVLILSDSSEIPTGITTLAEALSSGADVVISRGHSNSWPSEIAAKLPFTVVSSSADAAEIAQAIRDQLAKANKSRRQDLARQFALSYLSEEALVQNWQDILNIDETF